MKEELRKKAVDRVEAERGVNSEFLQGTARIALHGRWMAHKERPSQASQNLRLDVRTNGRHYVLSFQITPY